MNAFQQKSKYKNYPFADNGEIKQIVLNDFVGRSTQLTQLRRAAYAYEQGSK